MSTCAFHWMSKHLTNLCLNLQAMHTHISNLKLLMMTPEELKQALPEVGRDRSTCISCDILMLCQSHWRESQKLSAHEAVQRCSEKCLFDEQFFPLFRPSATVSRIDLMKSCMCRRGGPPPPPITTPPAWHENVMDGCCAQPLR